MRDVGRNEPVGGDKLNLTLDIWMQELAMKALGDRKGAVVVSTVDGEILALVSGPSFDSNLFGLPAKLEGGDAHAAELAELLVDEELPLLNRAIGATYPPGSLYKVVTSIAGLEGDFITAEETYNDTGVVQIGEFSFRNWYLTNYGGVEGQINLARALARSTDTYYYILGGEMGVDYLADWSRKFGLGRVTGVGLLEEKQGLVPDKQWKLDTRGERWYLGNTYHMSIGQGDLLVTPLQSHMMMSVIANRGMRCRPRLVFGAEFGEGVVCDDLEIADEYIDSVVEGLIMACASGGTGEPFFSADYRVACKTGTAEYGPRNEKGERETHAWYG